MKNKSIITIETEINENTIERIVKINDKVILKNKTSKIFDTIENNTVIECLKRTFIELNSGNDFSNF